MNKSIKFSTIGHGGARYEGRGVIQEQTRTGYVVRLTTDDFGGFGTYRKGSMIRVTFGEIISK